MGLQDRDYMRNRHKAVRYRRKLNWRQWLLAVSVVLGVISAAVYMVRDTKSLVDNFGPDPGSLVVNINTATSKQLQTVPGIGPTRAAQIIAGRPYESVGDLTGVVGIGTKTLEGLRPFVTVEGETASSGQ